MALNPSSVRMAVQTLGKKGIVEKAGYGEWRIKVLSSATIEGAPETQASAENSPSHPSTKEGALAEPTEEGSAIADR